MFLELLGLTPEQIAKNETWDPKKGRQEKDFGDRVGDSVMSLLTGSNYGEKVEQATKDRYVDNFEDVYGDRIRKTSGVAGYEQLGDLSRLTDRKLQQELLNRENTRTARSQAAATTGLDRNEFLTLTDPGEIGARASQLVKQERDTKVEKAEAKENRRYRDSQNLQLLQLENQQANLAADRQLRRDQQSYQNRVLDLKEARLTRRDRQAAIQQMMAGLAQLGASIAI